MYNLYHLTVSSVLTAEAVEEESEREKVLLVAVLVPVLSVVVLVVLLVPVMVGGWRFWAKRCALLTLTSGCPYRNCCSWQC